MSSENVFSAYLLLAQLPIDIKKKHGIKSAPKVPRFDLWAIAGYFKFVDCLTSPDGHLHMTLNDTANMIRKPNGRTATKFLQAFQSINFSSIFIVGEMGDGHIVAFGTPNRDKERKHKGKRVPNPFVGCDDGYIFIISEDWQTIEILVVNKGYYTIEANATAMLDGEYNDALEALRKIAKPYYNY